MKKISLFAIMMACALTMNAVDIWTGDKHVSWTDGGLQIAAEQFATAQAGQKLTVHYNGATDGIEFKVMNANFDHLAGSREVMWISGDNYVEQFLTVAAVDSLKAHGLEIIGANFNVTQVELGDGRDLIEGGTTIWLGYFWADSWSTLELYRDAYLYVDWDEVNAIRFYSEASTSEYVLKLMYSWEAEGLIADKSNMTDGEGYAELVLTADMRAKLANASHLMVQFNKEADDPFNVTDIVLMPVPGPDPTAISNTTVSEKAIKRFVNGQLVIEKNGRIYNALGAEL